MHTTTFAALANMSPHCQNLHPYAAQRMVGILYILARKYERVATRLQAIGSSSVTGFQGLDASNQEQEVAVRCWVLSCLVLSCPVLSCSCPVLSLCRVVSS